MDKWVDEQMRIWDRTVGRAMLLGMLRMCLLVIAVYAFLYWYKVSF